MQAYDEDTTRMGLNALAIAEASGCDVFGDDSTSITGSMLSLTHSNSAASFTHAAL